MAINIETNHSTVKISEDGTQAFLSLCPPSLDESYEVKDLKELLEKNGVLEGIKEEVLQALIETKDYFAETLVAEGTPVQDGKDGEYQFLFQIVKDKKPRILPDGSVDYGNMQDVAAVEEGAEIAYYKPAEPGSNGVDVFGKPILAKTGRELTPLKGKGFAISEDKKVYTALLTGKVEYENERLNVVNMITIDGDVTIITGNINFAGDVFVRGTVVTGMVITARGNITINGHVEGAQLIAGKDVILKNGMQGSGRGEIRAGGDVSGKFFEQTTIYAKGSIKANAILNCHMMSEQSIIVSGKKGIIVGGSIAAIQRVEATIIGNMSEVKTEIVLGVDKEIYEHMNKVKEKYDEILNEINRLETGIMQINKILEKGNNPDLAEKKLHLMRIKIEKDAVISSLQNELKNTKLKIENSTTARLVVLKSIYRGSKVSINGVTKMMESENYNVTYFKKANEIEFKANI
ncbi:MAG: FapA family protein [Acetivibrio sp.]